MTAGERSACPDENTLALLVEGAIAGGERDAIEHHLDACEACSQVLIELGLANRPRELPERYRLVGQLGVGAMGVVWEAEDTALGRRVALKFVRDDAMTDDEHRGRLIREARALAAVRHPNVIAVHDLGRLGDEADAEIFLALELVAGTDARAWRTAALRTTAEVLALWKQVAAGLTAVHRAGIVHRDLKPENVLVAEDGRIVIADFGLATGAPAREIKPLTKTGQVVGTPLYMPIEQLRGGKATPQSDQFSLCVCIWEALAGSRPFAVRGTIAAQGLALLEKPTIPPGSEQRLFHALARGLAPEPDQRWPDLDALVAALDEAISRPRWRRAIDQMTSLWTKPRNH